MEEKDEVLEALKQTSESLKEEITRFDKILSISTIKEEWQSILQKKLDMKIALFCVKKVTAAWEAHQEAQGGDA